jgi:diguanylate cyclase (GGDEF)-like protein
MAARKKKKTDPITQPTDRSKINLEKDQVSASAQPGNPIALLDAIAAISSPLEATRVAQVAAHQIMRFSDSDLCTISRWDAEENLVTLWAEFHRGSSQAAAVPFLPYPASDYPVTEQVLRTGQTVKLRINDPTLHEGERILMKSLEARVLLMLPLVSQEKTIGLIEVFETSARDDFSPEEVANIQVLAKHAGISLERASLLEEAKTHAADLEIIRQASLKLTSSLEQNQVLTEILKAALELSPDALDAHIFTVQEGELVFGASLWANGKAGPSYKQVRKGGLTDNVASSGEVMAIERVEDHPLFKNSEWTKKGWKGSIIGLPLKTGNAVVGVMNIAYRARQDFTEDRMRMLGLLGDQAAIAIYNARLHDLVKQQAITDPLTGLANRRAFNDRLDEEIQRSNRYQHSFSLLILDLDGFKSVNDTYGHIVGDKTLQEAANCLQSIVRETDFLARYGGDEFALILPETTKANALALIPKINQKLTDCPMPWPDNRVPKLRVSTGIANFPEDGATADMLISLADSTLYQAKRA